MRADLVALLFTTDHEQRTPRTQRRLHLEWRTQRLPRHLLRRSCRPPRRFWRARRRRHEQRTRQVSDASKGERGADHGTTQGARSAISFCGACSAVPMNGASGADLGAWCATYHPPEQHPWQCPGSLKGALCTVTGASVRCIQRSPFPSKFAHSPPPCHWLERLQPAPSERSPHWPFQLINYFVNLLILNLVFPNHFKRFPLDFYDLRHGIRKIRHAAFMWQNSQVCPGCTRLSTPFRDLIIGVRKWRVGLR